ncbi:hypothetical protein TNCV_4572771 [Trichonephila clavipes]|nr:hypothetical protein TNCV_4572771 [Trichonephila clavipes]
MIRSTFFIQLVWTTWKSYDEERMIFNCCSIRSGRKKKSDDFKDILQDSSHMVRLRRPLVLVEWTEEVVDYLSTVKDQLHLYMASVFSIGNGTFQQNSVPCQKCTIFVKSSVQEKVNVIVVWKFEDLHAEIVEVEIEVVSPSIVPSENFAELNRTVTCMVLKANDRRTSCPCHDEFRGPRSDCVRQTGIRAELQRMLLEGQEGLFQDCGIDSRKQVMPYVVKDKILLVLLQQIIIAIFCNQYPM